MEDLIWEYRRRFDENFPVFAPLPKGKSIKDVIEECLEKGKPFEPDYDDNADY